MIIAWPARHGSGAVLDSPVHRAELAFFRDGGNGSATRGCGRRRQGAGVEPVSGGPDTVRDHLRDSPKGGFFQ